MSDFMLWLYAHYIRPELDAAPQGDYSFHFDLLNNDLPAYLAESTAKILEFTAVQAFLLGLRTGRGLAE